MGPGQFVTQCVDESGRPGRTPACCGGSTGRSPCRTPPGGARRALPGPACRSRPAPCPACSSSTMTRPTSQYASTMAVLTACQARSRAAVRISRTCGKANRSLGSVPWLAGLGPARDRLGRRLLGWVAFLCHAVGIARSRVGGEMTESRIVASCRSLLLLTLRCSGSARLLPSWLIRSAGASHSREPEHGLITAQAGHEPFLEQTAGSLVAEGSPSLIVRQSISGRETVLLVLAASSGKPAASVSRLKKTSG